MVGALLLTAMLTPLGYGVKLRYISPRGSQAHRRDQNQESIFFSWQQLTSRMDKRRGREVIAPAKRMEARHLLRRLDFRSNSATGITAAVVGYIASR